MGLVVIVIYIIIGSLLIFTNYFTIVPEEYRTLSGWVVLMYGILRGVRVLTSKSNTETE